ncbi:MAG: DEAD/DEAH box helicase family protein [Armatimonadota bacterium]
MNQLYQLLAQRAQAWREAGYPSEAYPAIAEILDFQALPGEGALRFLRKPQLRALEIYWYTRLVEKTPHIFDLYKTQYVKQSALLEALGLTHSSITEYVLDEGIDALWQHIRTDDDFVRTYKLEALRETLTLDYPSYILALAMGAGKTILIGAIIATEFAMALEYPDGPFVQNALVFAPGKTIIESLRELMEIPYDAILPPRFAKPFTASVKLTFTRDGEKDIPVVRGSIFNVVVTNTEKIRIQKETIPKSIIGNLFTQGQEEQARADVANLRLQAIASLPHLAIFSDEAHHTYGQSLDSELKKVRKTVDYLAVKTNVLCVVNTTGTPYYQRQPLKDVIAWYGLSEGIRDGYLKDISGNIQSYVFSGDNPSAYVAHIIETFFQDYGNVRLPNGAPAKLAMYFPQTDDLRALKPIIDQALVSVGQNPSLCLVNTSDDSLTKPADVNAFNRLNDATAPHRVILLVNKGTEGWNCPSLFACALVRKLKTSNNFVLQASTRCMRQVPGNVKKARIYLSADNFGILDRQLQETYGETIAKLDSTAGESCRKRITLRKWDMLPLVVTREVRTVVRQHRDTQPVHLTKPEGMDEDTLTRQVFTIGEQQASYSVLQQVGTTEAIAEPAHAVDVYTAAVDLAACYRIPLWGVYGELRRLYADEDMPVAHIEALAQQIEAQTRQYEVSTEKVDVALALVKPEGFQRETTQTGDVVYTAEIVYPKDREHLLLPWDALSGVNADDIGFHYTPYSFDSNPEKSFYEQMLRYLHLHVDEVEDIYFTGALTDPGKTDFFVEYKDDKGKWRRYTPDFVLRKKNGKCLIVEVKAERERSHPIDGETGRKALALRKWEQLNPARLQYEMVFTAVEVVSWDDMDSTRAFVEEA